ncbi:MAG: outer membrane protein assembly factor BamD [Methyloprofundus sp.]|nr:outer membrane protein assembly factor BamD [Methyloprofundus sp.]
MPVFFNKVVLILCLSFFLQACTSSLDSLSSYLPSFSNEKKEKYDGWAAEQFIAESKRLLEEENYKKAVLTLEQLDSRYPFGPHSTQAQLDLTYAYYKSGASESALMSADRFIKTNPRHPNVDYAYYLKALVNFNRKVGFVDRYIPSDATQRDTLYIENAYLNFEELIRRFPDSQYVEDCKQRMVYLSNAMARHELHVARFYMDREAYIAAANRCNYIIEKYPNTPAIPYALEIQIKAYKKLGLQELVDNSSLVYNFNYPEGPQFSESDASGAHVVPFIWDVLGFDR